MRTSWWKGVFALVLLSTFTFDSRGVYGFFYEPVGVPLAVKSPFLSTWKTGSDGMGRNWPRSGGNLGVTGWAGFARVDGVLYSFLGAAADFSHNPGVWIGNAAQNKGLEITASQTIYTFGCGGMDVKVTFINPIEPSDFTRLSLPFIYVSVTATSNDGATHRVQIYSDLSGEWLSADSGKSMTWSTTKSDKLILHTFSLAEQSQFQATDNRVQYGLGYHAMLPSDGVTYQSGTDIVLRQGFNTGGILNNTADTNFRAINKDWPCFAFAKDLGNITDSSTTPVVFAVGLSRDPAISYTAGGTQQSRSLFYRTQFSTDTDAISFFLNDYELAVSSANNFDSKLSTAASQISGTYADLTFLAARQVASHIEVTVSTGSDGKLNASDIMVFMGNDGVNRLEEIYASAPFWIYVNPEILRLMLLPNIRWQQLSSTNPSYVVDDLGDAYPQASGPGSSLVRPKALESTGNMMITTAALIKATGNAAIVSENADLYKTWADYLKANALVPGTQSTTDGIMSGAPSNDTNLALKGIIALKAYADILSTLGQDGSTYSDTAKSYASQWQSMAEANAGFAANYGDSGSWSICYNLFADKWLKTGLFPESVFQKMGS
ncbi:hypothetical protein FRC19_002201, partial [Serendipita sp. 401]